MGARGRKYGLKRCCTENGAYDDEDAEWLANQKARKAARREVERQRKELEKAEKKIKKEEERINTKCRKVIKQQMMELFVERSDFQNLSKTLQKLQMKLARYEDKGSLFGGKKDADFGKTMLRWWRDNSDNYNFSGILHEVKNAKRFNGLHFGRSGIELIAWENFDL